MKTTVPGATVAVLIGSASAVLAATGAREDNSGLFVWVFLGFCALIIVAQLIPAIMVALGFAKAIGKHKEEIPHPVKK